MADVLIVQNITREKPGLLEEVLREEKLTFDVVDLDKEDTIPPPFDYKAMVVLGGPDSANDTTAKMEGEIEKARSVLEGSLPYLGICLGMQMLVKAAGGKVVKSPVAEVGFTDPDGQPFAVELTEAGRQDPLFKGLNGALRVFHLHGETVEITEDIELLATGKHCKNQIVRVGPSAYGIQSHFELTPKMLEMWAIDDPDLRPIGHDTLSQQLEAIEIQYEKTGRTLFRNFLRVAGLLG